MLTLGSFPGKMLGNLTFFSLRIDSPSLQLCEGLSWSCCDALEFCEGFWLCPAAGGVEGRRIGPPPAVPRCLGIKGLRFDQLIGGLKKNK